MRAPLLCYRSATHGCPFLCVCACDSALLKAIRQAGGMEKQAKAAKMLRMKREMKEAKEKAADEERTRNWIGREKTTHVSWTAQDLSPRSRYRKKYTGKLTATKKREKRYIMEFYYPPAEDAMARTEELELADAKQQDEMGLPYTDEQWDKFWEPKVQERKEELVACIEWFREHSDMDLVRSVIGGELVLYFTSLFCPRAKRRRQIPPKTPQSKALPLPFSYFVPPRPPRSLFFPNGSHLPRLFFKSGVVCNSLSPPLLFPVPEFFFTFFQLHSIDCAMSNRADLLGGWSQHF